tara:strand:+ start:379 stop:498 length:120 start_codon:yes stop_codon:yes gene_type:complete
VEHGQFTAKAQNSTEIGQGNDRRLEKESVIPQEIALELD